MEREGVRARRPWRRNDFARGLRARSPEQRHARSIPNLGRGTELTQVGARQGAVQTVSRSEDRQPVSPHRKLSGVAFDSLFHAL